MKKNLRREELTDEQLLFVKLRATDIWSDIALKGNTCYSYGNDYHFWWDGVPHGMTQPTPSIGGLVDLDDLEDIWTTLKYRHYIQRDERPYWKVIAEELRTIAYGFCTPVPADPRLDKGIAHTRGKHWRHITVKNYIWEWFRGTHTTMTI